MYIYCHTCGPPAEVPYQKIQDFPSKTTDNGKSRKPTISATFLCQNTSHMPAERLPLCVCGQFTKTLSLSCKFLKFCSQSHFLILDPRSGKIHPCATKIPDSRHNFDRYRSSRVRTVRLSVFFVVEMYPPL